MYTLVHLNIPFWLHRVYQCASGNCRRLKKKHTHTKSYEIIWLCLRPFILSIVFFPFFFLLEV